jgi:hypothetical protein
MLKTGRRRRNSGVARVTSLTRAEASLWRQDQVDGPGMSARACGAKFAS